MLQREYDIHVYSPGRGLKRLFSFRRWMLVLPLGLLLASVAANLALWRYYAGFSAMQGRTLESERVLSEQKAEALRLRERVRRVREEVERVGAFNEKLGVMVGVRPAAVGLGAPAPTAPALSPRLAGREISGKLSEFLEALSGRIAVQEILQQELSRGLAERKLEFEAKPSLWPARGYISSGFGGRSSPFGRGGDFHNGVDIKVPTGSPVFAPGAGRVIEADYMTGYGLRVVLAHDYGLETVFAHLSKAEVKPGQAVKRGQLIGHSGNSGRTTGAHLHYEVHVHGEPVNPRGYMLD